MQRLVYLGSAKVEISRKIRLALVDPEKIDIPSQEYDLPAGIYPAIAALPDQMVAGTEQERLDNEYILIQLNPRSPSYVGMKTAEWAEYERAHPGTLMAARVDDAATE